MAVGRGVSALWQRWLRQVFPEGIRQAKRRGLYRGLLVERLEPRLVLSTFFVTPTGSDGNSGLLSGQPLRTIQQAIIRANSSSGPHVINMGGGTYSNPGLDTAINIPNATNLTNLQVLGGWNTGFTLRDPVATPSVYMTLSSGTAASPDVTLGATNVSLDGITFIFDGQQGTGGSRTSGGVQVQGTGITLNNLYIEVGSSSSSSSADAYGIQTQQNGSVSGLTISNTTVTASALNASSGIYLRPGTNSGTITVIANKVGGDNVLRGIIVDSISNVTVSSNTLDRNGPLDALFNPLIFAGPLTGNVDQSNIQIIRNSLDNNLSGNSTGNTIANSIGIEVGNSSGSSKISNLLVSENYVFDGRVGIQIDRNVNSTSTQIRGNSITGNSTGISRTFDSGQIIDVAGNWWGDALGPKVASNPRGSGDTAVTVGASEQIDYSPWLSTGTDDDAVTLGFQGNFKQLTVNDSSPKTNSQTTGNFQEGVNSVVGSGTLIPLAGTYDESVTVGQTLTISPDDTGTGTVILSGSGGNSSLGGATYLVDLTIAPASDLLQNNAGTLTLTNTTLKVSSTSTSNIGQQFTIVTSNGGISGTFNNLPNNKVFVGENGRTYQIKYTTTTVTLLDIVDTTPPTATVTTDVTSFNVANSTSATNALTITYADAETGVDSGTFATTNISVTNGTTTAQVTAFTFVGNAVTYTIVAPNGTWGASPQGTYTVALNTGTTGVSDYAGNAVAATLLTAFNVDTVPITVTIEQAAGQADPTSGSPINFTVTFSEVVSGFTASDVSLSGTAGASIANVSPAGGSSQTWNVAVSGMAGDGTVIASVVANAASDSSGNSSAASTSVDNTVTYDTTPPTATVTTAAPTITAALAGTTTTTVTITYSDATAGIDASSFATSNISVTNGATIAPVSNFTINGNAVTYIIDSPGSNWGGSAQGIYTIALNAGVRDLAGNVIAANTTFSTFVVDTIRPTALVTTPAPTINVASAGTTSTTVTVTYADTGSSVNPASFGTSNITVTNGATPAAVTGFSFVGNAVTYTISSPGSTWGASTQGTYKIALNAGVRDVAGNTVTADAAFSTFIVDTVSPTATVTTPAPTINIATSATTSTSVTITYSDVTTGVDPSTFATSNISVTNGATTATVTGFSFVGNAVTYTINAPTSTWGASTQGTYAIALNAGVRDLAGNTITGNAAFSSFVVDTIQPTATVTTPAPTINVAAAGTTSTTVTMTYADTVSGIDTSSFGTSNITVTNGATVTGFSFVGNAVTYTITAPSSTWGASTQGTYTIALNAGVRDIAGNTISANATFSSFIVDTVRPTALVTAPAPTINVAAAGTTSTTVTITYSDATAGIDAASFANSNITVTNGAATAAVTGFSFVGNAVTYTINSPASSWGASAQGTYTIVLNAAVRDLAGNTVSANTAFSSFVVDTIRPTPTVTTPAPTINVATAGTSSTTVTITYADAGSGIDVSSLAASNITVTNGATTALVTGISPVGNAVTYTINSPSSTWGGSAQGTYTIALNAGVTDLAGNAVTANAAFSSFVVDTVRPTATVTTPAPTINVATAATNSTTVTVTYADTGSGIDASSFGTSNITVTNGATNAAVTGFSFAGNAVTYTISSPAATWGASTQGTYTIALSTGVRDLAGNTVTANSAFSTFTVDTVAPAATVTTPAPTINVATAGTTTTTITITYSDATTGIDTTSFAASNITVANGGTTAPVTNVSAVGNVVTYTINSPGSTWGASPQGTYSITLHAGVRDFAGNSTTDTPAFSSFIVDTVRPTATVTTPAPTINVATAGTSTTTVTITYGDTGSGIDPSTFAASNISVANAGITAPVTSISISGNAVTYTINSPSSTWGASTQGTYTIALNAGVRDLAGNSVTANTGLRSFIVDTTPLTVTINQDSGQTDPTQFPSIDFTVSFDKPVTGFAANDIVLSGTAGATLAVITPVGITNDTWTVTVSGMTSDGTVTASISAGAAFDAAGNTNNASTSTDNSVTYDATPPTATVTTPSPNILAAVAGTTTTTITITYADPTSGIDPATFSTGDISVTNGGTIASVTGVSVAAGNVVTYTISAPSSTWGLSPQGTYTVSLSSSVADVADNVIVGDPNFSFFTVDTALLTATINQAAGQSDPTNSATINFRVVFNKPVFGFATGDVTLGGTAGATTATVTPAALGGVTWNVAVSGMTTDGTVTPTIATGVATDLAGNPNLVSTSADNTVTFDRTAPSATVTTPAPTLTTAAANATTTTITITYSDVLTGINTGTFGTNNISVTNGATVALVTGFTAVGNAVTYTIAAPSGTWGKSPAGTYTVALSGATPGGVSDVAGNVIAAKALSTFLVDMPTVSLSVNPPSIAEAGGTTTVTATLSAPSTLPVTVNLGFTGTANTGDYTASSAQILIPVGGTTGTTTITAVQDTQIELNETVVVDITNVTNGFELGIQQVTAIILDDDAIPDMSIGDVSVMEGTGTVHNAVFTITLSLPCVQTVTVTANTANGTATAPGDYTAVVSQIVTFNPGETTKTVSVAIIPDPDDEDDETFFVNLSAATNANLVDAQGTATVADDEARMLRVYNPNAGLHVFTTSRGEFNALLGLGYRDETTNVTGFTVSLVALPGAMPVHRMYNPNAGHHYFTTSDGERDFLAAHGWNAEPDQGYLYPAVASSATEIYHIYNADNGDHLYTANDLERVYILTHPLFPTPWSQQTSLGYIFTAADAVAPRQHHAVSDEPPVSKGIVSADETTASPTLQPVSDDAESIAYQSATVEPTATGEMAHDAELPPARLKSDDDDLAALDAAWAELADSLVIN